LRLPVYTHAAMLGHAPGAGHPERPQRLSTVLDALDDSGLDLERRHAPKATRAALQRVHPEAYVDRIVSASPESGLAVLDADTTLSPGSLDAALRATGAGVQAVEDVAAGRQERAFCAVRPPGHHAEPDSAMGFCLFSSVAVAARAAQVAGLRRVAIVDFDVHHGNGTQAVVERDPSLFFASVHQMPLYPGTGAADETGVGNVANAPVAPGASPAAWRAAFASLMPAVDAFAPDLILVSAGFDAHRRDPLAHQELEAGDFAWATAAILEVARARSHGRVVSSLEGGYDLEALGRSAAAHVRALAEG
jgi:acetoin utilization deacetylase AcuC-like enzyme